ncbi:hypothetical protein ACFE04_001725 [Oxalis oulophora]
MDLLFLSSTTCNYKPLLSPIFSHASIKSRNHSLHYHNYSLKVITNNDQLELANLRFKSFAICDNSGSKLISSNQPKHSWIVLSKHRGRVFPVLAVSGKIPDDESSSEDEDDPRAMETVLKLYSAIKNKNLSALSDIIDDECRCVFSFGSFVQPFQGKEQVLRFLNSLMSNMGRHFEFVVEPTLHQGTSVGVKWKIAWKKNYEPFGKGFGFHICHDYRGDMFIRNIEMFVEPLLLLEPMRLKMMAYAIAIPVILSPDSPLRRKIIIAFGVLVALLVAACHATFVLPQRDNTQNKTKTQKTKSKTSSLPAYIRRYQQWSSVPVVKKKIHSEFYENNVQNQALTVKHLHTWSGAI